MALGAEPLPSANRRGSLPRRTVSRLAGGNDRGAAWRILLSCDDRMGQLWLFLGRDSGGRIIECFGGCILVVDQGDLGVHAADLDGKVGFELHLQSGQGEPALGAIKIGDPRALLALQDSLLDRER